MSTPYTPKEERRARSPKKHRAPKDKSHENYKGAPTEDYTTPRPIDNQKLEDLLKDKKDENNGCCNKR
jgi:hypothetical protein